MGDEQGDRSAPLLVYWIIYQSGQLGEVGVFWRRDYETPRTGGEAGWHLVDLLTTKAGRSLKHFGLAFATDLSLEVHRIL